MGKIRKSLPERPQSIEALRAPLEKLYQLYDFSFLNSDPLRIVHQYSSPKNQEVVGLIAALFAFGNVRSILTFVESLLNVLGPSPAEAVQKWPNQSPPEIRKMRHRWVKSSDIHDFMLVIRKVLKRYGSIHAAFLKYYARQNGNLECALIDFMTELRSASMSTGLGFLLASPRNRSTCKRINLYLRWMIRPTKPDLGIWPGVSPAQLFLPIDTHLARIIRYIGLVTTHQVGWNMVTEASDRLRLLDPHDPIRFDFALARLGILNQCRHRYDSSVCPACPLNRLCVLAAAHA